jgi:N-acetylglutamate synthase-like GNAT family acetyltransferase
VLRPAKNEDIPQIVELAVESVSQDNWPLTICRPRMRNAIQESMKSGFVWVSDIDGVKGAVVAIKHEGFWFAENQASVLMFYCKTGEGYKLLKKMSDWIKADGIALATVFLERFMDERYVRMFKRLGFTRQAPALSYVRNL